MRPPIRQTFGKEEEEAITHPEIVHVTFCCCLGRWVGYAGYSLALERNLEEDPTIMPPRKKPFSGKAKKQQVRHRLRKWSALRAFRLCVCVVLMCVCDYGANSSKRSARRTARAMRGTSPMRLQHTQNKKKLALQLRQSHQSRRCCHRQRRLVLPHAWVHLFFSAHFGLNGWCSVTNRVDDATCVRFSKSSRKRRSKHAREMRRARSCTHRIAATPSRFTSTASSTPRTSLRSSRSPVGIAT